jgi:hypothetical protein
MMYFLFHEDFLPYCFGIPEVVELATYAGFLLLPVFQVNVLRTNYILLGVALGFFAASVCLDIWEPSRLDPFLKTEQNW